MIKPSVKNIISALALILWANAFGQAPTDTIEDHLVKLYRAADNKAVIDYALKVQADHPRLAREVVTDYYIVRSAIDMDNAALADRHAAKVLKASSKEGGYELDKADVCVKMANYYQGKGLAEKELYWLKLRLYKWNMERCGVGKKRRNIELYERIISCYEQLGDTANKNSFEKKLATYTETEGNAWKTP